MVRLRFPAATVLCAALLTACAEGGAEVVAAPSTTTLAGGEVVTTTTAPPSTTTTTTTLVRLFPITFILGINDDGLRLRLRPGDEVVPRLPVAASAETGWVLLVAPDPRVLAGGDDLLWRPSETNQGRLAFHEFYFIAAGPGQTTVILNRGWQDFSFTVVVSGYQ